MMLITVENTASWRWIWNSYTYYYHATNVYDRHGIGKSPEIQTTVIISTIIYMYVLTTGCLPGSANNRGSFPF